MSGVDRRAVILSAARHDFAAHGFSGTSTARIAEAAGCSEPMLYKHFSSKHELFCAVLDEVCETMENAVDDVLTAPGDPLENWLAFVPITMRSEAYAEMVGLRKLAVTIVDEPLIRQRLAEGTDRLVARVTSAVERSREVGSVRDDVDPEYVAWVWLGITLAASYRRSIEGTDGFSSMSPHAITFMESLRR